MGKVFQLRGAAKRPMPPIGEGRYQPARGVAEWVQEQILSADGAVHNPDHVHLLEADLEFLWAPAGFVKQMRTVLGQAEEVMIRAGGWQKGRQEQQFYDWFGRVPAFLITFDAQYASVCSDAEWCALVEHELYHVAHALDEFGTPKFTKDGPPKLTLCGHDVEEFVGVVRRYGVGDPGGAISRLAAAARGTPEVSAASIASACGTCMRRAA